MNATVSVKHLSKHYSQQGETLHDISFDLHHSQVLAYSVTMARVSRR